MAKESDKEPGLIALALQGVKLVGVRGALRIATYGLWKARLDKRYLKDRPTGPELRPGSKGEVELGGRTDPDPRRDRLGHVGPDPIRRA